MNFIPADPGYQLFAKDGGSGRQAVAPIIGWRSHLSPLSPNGAFRLYPVVLPYGAFGAVDFRDWLTEVFSITHQMELHNIKAELKRLQIQCEIVMPPNNYPSWDAPRMVGDIYN